MITRSRLVYESSPAGSLELGREGGSSGRAMCCGSLVCVRRGGGGGITARACPSSCPSSSSSSSPASLLLSAPLPLMSLLPQYVRSSISLSVIMAVEGEEGTSAG